MKVCGFSQLIGSILVSFVACDGGPKWDYHDVSSWYGICPTGRSQSPIVLSEAFSHKKTERRFSFVRYNEPGRKMVLTNNGHTLRFEIGAKHKYKIKNGGLPGKEFDLVQGHFHWGLDNSKGSEHIVNRIHFPMELHLVHKNNDLGKTFNDAVKASAYNSLAVLGIMFEVQEDDNPKLKPLVKVLEVLKKEKDETTIMDLKDFPLTNFLPRNTDTFYRYNGSLTTPSCLEIVVWTVFKQPVGISQSQLDAFRLLTRKTDDGGTEPVGNNFRPTQDLNGRTILDVDTSRKFFAEGEDYCSGVAGRIANPAIWISSLSLFAMFYNQRA